MPLELASVAEGGQGLSLKLEVGNLGDVLDGEPGVVGRDQGSGRVGKRQDLATELDDLVSGVLGDVSGTRDQDPLSLEVGVVHVPQHALQKVDTSVTGSLGSDVRSTPGETLSGEDPGKLVSVLLVGTEHVTDLSTSGTDVTSGNVGVGADVSGELEHEGVAL